MACKASFDLYHNFPKLAEEAGFAFNTHRPRVHIEWNKIRLLDIDSLIRERKFVLIEQHINDILDCVLESEFDVRILDEGVVKIFRLAQLAVEYQQFCRHYLDRSVYVLREEVTSLAKELEAHKRNLREKEDDVRRLRKKSRHVTRTPQPYANENIAAIILNTLKNQSDIFPSAPHLDAIQHNKCQYCDKVFLNQLYLKSHVLRRHSNVSEVLGKDVTREANKDVSENITQSNPDENIKLHSEIEILKSKLKEMENLISQTYKSDNHRNSDTENNPKDFQKVENTKKETKDAEVLTQNTVLLENGLERLEKWKQEEFDKYHKELSLLRTQITELIDSDKNKKNQNTTSVNDVMLIEQLQRTIAQQGAQMLTLQQELLNYKSNKDTLEIERKKEMESLISVWSKKVEAQTNECKILLQKLNDTDKEVHQYKVLADAEREKALQLQEMLNKQLPVIKKNTLVEDISPTKQNGDTLKIKLANKANPTADRVTLQKLQKQAQDLLNIEQSTTDSSTSTETSNVIPKTSSNDEHNAINNKYYNKKPSKNHRVEETRNNHKKLSVKGKKPKMKPLLLKNNGQVTASPVKVVRAKITEEVNQRLIQLGVDPLKNRLPKTTYHKQRTMLQEQQELKVKKYPSREKIYHSIITHLDTNTMRLPQMNASDEKYQEENSPGKANKTFNLASVISNVKTKALSLVKSNEVLNKKNGNKMSESVTQKALALLKTPPSSLQSSPQNIKDTKPSQYRYNNEVKKVVYGTQELSKHALRNKPETSDSDTEQLPISYNKELKLGDDILINSPSRIKNNKKSVDLSSKKIINGTRDINTDKKTDNNNIQRQLFKKHQESSSDDIESLDDIVSPRKAFSEESLNPKQTKGVLRNASSTSSLNKKKVLFDMEAIQMKSISASPSQSLGEKSDDNEKYTLGIINLDTEEWDPSSIENEIPNNPTIQISSRTSPKIAELKHVIESQMARRIQTPNTMLAGSVNVLPTPVPMARTSLGGSNTSLGSSILDESENLSITNKGSIAPKKLAKKDDSEIDFSEFLIDDKSDNKF